MLNPSTIQPLLQKTVNLLASSAEWDDCAAMRAHIYGLQGEKRRLRYFRRKCLNVIDCLKHSPLDMFRPRVELQHPTANPANVANLMDCKTTMNGIIDKFCRVYDELHSIANDMVASKYRKYTKTLYCLTDWLFDTIGELNRAYDEYEKAGWEYHHISRYQVSYYNVHDKYEEKEEDQGYGDGKKA